MNHLFRMHQITRAVAVTRTHYSLLWGFYHFKHSSPCCFPLPNVHKSHKFSQCFSSIQRTCGWLSERFKQPARNYSENPKGHTTLKCLALGQELVFTQQLKDSEGFWRFHHSWKKGDGHLHLITEQLSSDFTEYGPKFNERVSFAIQVFPCSWSKNYIQKARKINLKINNHFYVFHLHSQVYRIGMYYSWTMSGIWVSGMLLNDIQKNKKATLWILK